MEKTSHGTVLMVDPCLDAPPVLDGMRVVHDVLQLEATPFDRLLLLTRARLLTDAETDAPVVIVARDHLSFFSPPPPSCVEGFPGMDAPYDAAMARHVWDTATRQGLTVYGGVIAWITALDLLTTAEMNVLRAHNAIAALEGHAGPVIAARARNASVLAVGLTGPCNEAFSAFVQAIPQPGAGPC